MYADSITKKFLTYGTNVAEAGPNDSRIADHQDPTYMGFQIRIKPSLNSTSDLDTLPHGIFTADPINDPYSCYNYLLSRGEYKRAAYILTFEKDFVKLVDECPWFFVKVSGLADAWKIDPKINWRGKEKKIVIETLESIDMKMTYLMDLYRKATFDYAYMRWAVPDHMRYFKLNVIVSEIRPMKISTVAGNASIFSGPILTDGSNYQDTVNKMQAEQENKAGLYDTAAPWTAGSFVKFQFEQCEFDFMSEAPSFLESVGSSTEAIATNKITIKTNMISERNVYGLLGAIVDDTQYVFDYGQSAADESLGYPHPLSVSNEPLPAHLTLQATGFTDYAKGMNDRKSAQDTFNSDHKSVTLGTSDAAKDVKEKWDSEHSNSNNTNVFGTPDAAKDVKENWDSTHKDNNTNVFGSSSSPGAAAAAAKDKTAAGKLLSNLGKSALAGAKDFAKSLVKSQVNALLLGNAYGLSPLSLVSSAQSVLNNPAGAVQNLLAKHSSPAIASVMSKKVELTAAEMNLVQQIIGKAAEISGTKMAVENPGKTNLESVNIISSKPGNVEQTGAPIKKGSKEKTNLTAFSKAGSKQKSVKLVGAIISPAKLGNVGLEAPNITPGDLGKTDFK